MSGKVLEFKTRPTALRDEDDGHVAGELRCFGCGHEWIGAYPVGVTEFKCPGCGTMKGRSKFECMPSDGEEIFVCPCGNYLLVITPRSGPLCPNCGRYHRPYDNPKGAA